MLQTEQNTPAMEKKVRSAVRQKFHKRHVDTVFEHGQWWVTFPPMEAENVEVIFSVVDAEPGIGDTGLDFEEV
jgi:hypothetical protein